MQSAFAVYVGSDFDLSGRLFVADILNRNGDASFRTPTPDPVPWLMTPAVVPALYCPYAPLVLTP